MDRYSDFLLLGASSPLLFRNGQILGLFPIRGLLSIIIQEWTDIRTFAYLKYSSTKRLQKLKDNCYFTLVHEDKFYIVFIDFNGRTITGIGWSGGAKVLGKLSVLGHPTILITVGQGPTALAVGAGGGCLDIFTLIYPFSPLSPSLWETARYRLKYCLKGPLNPKQPTNHYWEIMQSFIKANYRRYILILYLLQSTLDFSK